MIQLSDVTAILDSYLLRFPGDRERLARVLEILAETGYSFVSRTEFRGHVTVNAVLVNDAQQVLLIHHVALDRWLTPGGHLEAGDASLLAAARRELAEETGVAGPDVVPMFSSPVDIDVHGIPANTRKAEPAHQHFDFRFLFRIADAELVPQLDEVHAAQWRPIADIPADRLRQRVVEALTGVRSQ